MHHLLTWLRIIWKCIHSFLYICGSTLRWGLILLWDFCQLKSILDNFHVERTFLNSFFTLSLLCSQFHGGVILSFSQIRLIHSNSTPCTHSNVYPKMTDANLSYLYEQIWTRNLKMKTFSVRVFPNKHQWVHSIWTFLFINIASGIPVICTENISIQAKKSVRRTHFR